MLKKAIRAKMVANEQIKKVKNYKLKAGNLQNKQNFGSYNKLVCINVLSLCHYL